MYLNDSFTYRSLSIIIQSRHQRSAHWDLGVFSACCQLVNVAQLLIPTTNWQFAPRSRISCTQGIGERSRMGIGLISSRRSWIWNGRRELYYPRENHLKRCSLPERWIPRGRYVYPFGWSATESESKWTCSHSELMTRYLRGLLPWWF
jgi:hypothetical protein